MLIHSWLLKAKGGQSINACTWHKEELQMPYQEFNLQCLKRSISKRRLNLPGLICVMLLAALKNKNMKFNHAKHLVPMHHQKMAIPFKIKIKIKEDINQQLL